ncbi:MAG TPA: cytochrome c [Lacipirellulaceae bacterium]|nr:cytochrome c [Lacipirellulaceae bacterium]
MTIKLKVLPIAAAAFISVVSICQAEQPTGAGEKIYMQSRCFVCHGQLGTGGFGSALAGDRILAIKQFVIAQILIGRGKMPPFGGQLSDDDVAAVAQYIRNNWGNDFGPVTANDVKSVRALMKKATEQSAKIANPQQ